MSYTPTTDFLALLRETAGGVRTERMPGLDYVIDALRRAGLITLSVGQNAPTSNQATTVWFKPATSSWTAEGVVFLWDKNTLQYEIATPDLWSQLIAGFAIDLIPLPSDDAPLMNGIAASGVSTEYSRKDHVHPTDTTLAPLNSPALSGNPTAPTQTLGDNSTKLATTAFVIANGALPPPIGAVLPYSGTSAPSAQWVLCNGQAINRVTFASLFALIGITFGSGDGVNTFNVPDLRGRVIAGVDGGANRLTTATMSSQALAGVGGTEQVTLTLAQIPGGITSAATNLITVNTSNNDVVRATSLDSQSPTGGANSAIHGVPGAGGSNTSQVVQSTGNNSISVTANNTGGQAHSSVQPTMELNYLLRVA